MRDILALGIPAMLAGAAVMIPLAWSSLQWGWGLMGILLSITALMSWRGATNMSRFAGNGWQRSSLEPSRPS